MEPVSILDASATFLAAEVARKPADAFATKLWETVKAALRKVLDREPTPTDVSAATIRKIAEEVPAVAGALQAARSGASGFASGGAGQQCPTWCSGAPVGARGSAYFETGGTAPGEPHIDAVCGNTPVTESRSLVRFGEFE